MVFQNHASKTLAQMAQYTVTKFLSLAHGGQSAFTDAVQVGQPVHIDGFESTIPAVVTAEPLFDPAMTRVRA